MFAMIRVEFF